MRVCLVNNLILLLAHLNCNKMKSLKIERTNERDEKKMKHTSTTLDGPKETAQHDPFAGRKKRWKKDFGNMKRPPKVKLMQTN